MLRYRFIPLRFTQKFSQNNTIQLNTSLRFVAENNSPITLYDSIFKAIQHYEQTSPEFWAKVRAQVDLIKAQNLEARVLSAEELSRMDHTLIADIVRHYDEPIDRTRLAPLIQLLSNDLFEKTLGGRF
jgi:plasmid maintenance system antidote protein VapI